MTDKSPRQSMTEKSSKKSIKEKRADKRAKGADAAVIADTGSRKKR